MADRFRVSPPRSVSRRRFTAFLLGLAAAVTLSPRVARAEGPASWRVGFLDNYPPFSSLGPNKTLHGFDFEVVSQLARALGITVEAVPGSMVELQRRLKAGEIDFIGNQLLVSPENRRQYDFVKPYAVNQLVCVQHEDDLRDFLSLDDLFGLKVGVLAHTGVEEQVREVIGKKATVAVPHIQEALQMLAHKKIDAVLEESLIVDYHIEHMRLPIKTTAPFAPPSKIGLAVPKGRAALRSTLEEGIGKLVKEPSFTEISTRWFGYDVSRNRASAAFAMN